MSAKQKQTPKARRRSARIMGRDIRVPPGKRGRIAKPRVLTIGIMSHEQLKERLMKIARGELVPGPKDPKMWFDSVQAIGQVLNAGNIALLHLIRDSQPQSIAELAGLAGRDSGNLTRTLRTMESYNLIELQEGEGLAKRPVARYDRVDLQVGIA